MAKAPTQSPFSPDFYDEDRRIWEERRDRIIWPDWKTYQEYRKRFRDNRSNPVWNTDMFGYGDPFPYPIKKSEFATWRENMIRTYVEETCQPLVRRILDAGHFTLYSNSFGGGDKGVEFTPDLFTYSLPDRGRYFMYLENWDTEPKVVSANWVTSSGYPQPDVERSKEFAKELGLEPLPVTTPQPNLPAKKARARKATPRRDNG